MIRGGGRAARLRLVAVEDEVEVEDLSEQASLQCPFWQNIPAGASFETCFGLSGVLMFVV
jgi:hypothetical protein